jgi:hypothetical protein
MVAMVTSNRRSEVTSETRRRGSFRSRTCRARIYGIITVVMFDGELSTPAESTLVT